MNIVASEMVQNLIPLIFADNVERAQLPPHTDMSRSNRCYNLTLDLYETLAKRGLPARRELHKTPGGLWHYVIAHANEDAAPTDDDTITDLNPWQFTGAQGQGALHAERSEVQDILRTSGAPEWFVSLRGISTIAQAHTDRLLPGPEFPELRLG